MSESNPAYQREHRGGKVPVSTKFYQGVGTIPDTVKNLVFNTFILLFYNQILGMDAFYVSVALGLATFVDAFTDPIIASLSDNARTRWGRRHPFMLGASLPLGLGIYLVFAPPAGLSDLAMFLWLFFFVIFTRTCMSLFTVPYGALAAELSDDYDERTSIMAYRFALGWFIGVSFPVFIYTFVMPATDEYPAGQLNPDAYPIMGIYAAVLLTSAALFSTVFTWRDIPYLRQHITETPGFSFRNTFEEVIRAFKTKQFTLLFSVILLISIFAGVTRNLTIYMYTFFWGLTTEELRWLAIAAIGAIIGFAIVSPMQRRWDKKDIVIGLTVVSIFDGMFVVALRFLDVLPANGDPWLLVILIAAATFAAGLAVVQGILFVSLIADALDAHELRTGYRQEGMFYAGFGFSAKAASGLGIVFGGLIISIIQFPTQMMPTEVPSEMITRLGVFVGLAVPLLYLIPTYLATKYDITREVHAEIRAELDARNGTPES